MLKLQKKLKNDYGLVFNDEDLLKTAFTHSSFTNEERLPKIANNERLEFLGDVALSLVISDYLYRTYPEKLEGELSKMRSSIVRTESLANFSRSCGFGEFLRLGHGEEKMGGRDRETTLENLFEAFLGALFIDQGMDEVRKFIQHVVIPHVKNDDYVKVIDYKTELQEVLQIGGETTISYKILKEEFLKEKELAQLEKEFYVDDHKKVAEQKAAENAIKGQNHVS